MPRKFAATWVAAFANLPPRVANLPPGLSQADRKFAATLIRPIYIPIRGELALWISQGRSRPGHLPDIFKQLFLDMSPRWTRGRALALWVEPASGLQRPPGRLTIPHAGGRPAAIPLGCASPLALGQHGACKAPCNSLLPPGGGPRCRRVISGHCVARGRSPRGVHCPSETAPSTIPQTSSPLRPTLSQDRAKALWVSPGGIRKSAIYKPSPLRNPIPAPLQARRRTQGNGASRGRLHGQQTTVVRL